MKYGIKFSSLFYFFNYILKKTKVLRHNVEMTIEYSYLNIKLGINMKKNILLITISILCFSQIAMAQQNILQNPKFKKAKTYYYNGKFAMAKIFLQDLTLKYPEDPELYIYLADTMFQLNEYQSAILNYKRANELLPQSEIGQKIKAQNYIQMGNIYFLQKKADESMAHYELAAMTHAEQSIGYYYQGLAALYLARDKKQTIRYWQEYTMQAQANPLRQRIMAALDILRSATLKIPPEGAPLSIDQVLARAGIHLPKPYPADKKKQDDKKNLPKNNKKDNKKNETKNDNKTNRKK